MSSSSCSDEDQATPLEEMIMQTCEETELEHDFEKEIDAKKEQEK